MYKLSLSVCIALYGAFNLAAQPSVLNMQSNQVTSISTNTNMTDIELEKITGKLHCILIIDSNTADTGAQPLAPKIPICYIYLKNDSKTDTIQFVSIHQINQTNLFDMELFDSQGRLIPKTVEGEKYGQLLTQESLDEWYQKLIKSRPPGGKWLGTYSWIAPEETSMVGMFSIKDMFKISKVGEYTIHVRVRLIQVKRFSFGGYYFPSTWLAEVATKVQIM